VRWPNRLPTTSTSAAATTSPMTVGTIAIATISARLLRNDDQNVGSLNSRWYWSRPT
jgi:hypothetical protein